MNVPVAQFSHMSKQLQLIDTIIFYQITDPKLFAYGVENPIVAIKSLTATTLRNIVGDLVAQNLQPARLDSLFLKLCQEKEP